MKTVHPIGKLFKQESKQLKIPLEVSETLGSLTKSKQAKLLRVTHSQAKLPEEVIWKGHFVTASLPAGCALCSTFSAFCELSPMLSGHW